MPTTITTVPTTVPTTKATTIPTTVPTTKATTVLTTVPTTKATTVPTTVPTTKATTVPTTKATTVPTTKATTVPTTIITTNVSTVPTTIILTAPVTTTATTTVTTVTTTPPVTTTKPVTTTPSVTKPFKFVMDTVSCERTSKKDVEVTMKIRLKDNAIGFSAFQGDLVFGNGAQKISCSEVFADEYAGQWRVNTAGNIIQFVSDSGHNIDTTDGVFAEVELLIPADVPAGQYNISMENVTVSVLTEDGQVKYAQGSNYFEVEKGKLSITDSFDIDPVDSVIKIPQGMTASEMISSMLEEKFYYSYDKNQFDLTGLKVEIEKLTSPGSKEIIDISKYIRVKGGLTPESVYDNKHVAYDIPLEINPDMLTDGKYLEFNGQQYDISGIQKAFDGTTMRVYIGQRGDINLDGKVDTRDATSVIREYNAVSMGDPTTINEIVSKSAFVTDDLTDKDCEQIVELCKFLGDVSVNSTTSHTLDTRDETGIIKFYNEYSMAAMDGEVDVKGIWDKIFKK